jgi:CRP-like cAMP-binding protein
VTDRLTAVLEEEDVRAGEWLFAAGELPDSFYFVRQGRVEILQQGKRPHTLEGHTVVGLFDALSDHPRTRSARAETDLRVMRAPADVFVELLEDSFDLSRTTFLGLAGAGATLEERLWAKSGPRHAGASREFPKASRLNVVERLAALIDAPLLRGVGVQALSELAASAREVTLEPEQALVGRGDSRDHVFLVLDGEVEATRTAPDVRWIGGPGEIVCSAAAFTERARAWQAQARVRTRCLAFALEDWFDLMEDHFDMVRSTLRLLATHIEVLRDELSTSALNT